MLKFELIQIIFIWLFELLRKNIDPFNLLFFPSSFFQQPWWCSGRIHHIMENTHLNTIPYWWGTGHPHRNLFDEDTSAYLALLLMGLVLGLPALIGFMFFCVKYRGPGTSLCYSCRCSSRPSFSHCPHLWWQWLWRAPPAPRLSASSSLLCGFHWGAVECFSISSLRWSSSCPRRWNG